MIRNVYLTLAILLAVITGSFAQTQTGSIKGKIYDKATKEPLAFASVVAEMNGTQAGGAQSDIDGNYLIKPLNPGLYTIRISYVGYNDLVINNVQVKVDGIAFQDLPLSKKVVETQEVEVVDYKVPLIDKGNTQTGATLTAEEIQAAPTRDVRSVAALTAGVLQEDEGDDINVRGSRSDATDYYVDGIRIRGSQKLPQMGIEQATVIVGGTPAQYGDATGGIVSITTRGPSSQWNGGIEYVTSELTDQYGYNLVSANLSGPILKKKLENGMEKPILGVFLSGEYQFEKDADPSAIGVYKLKDNLYKELSSNPVVPYQTGPTTFGFYNAAQFYRADAFENVKTKNNVDQSGYRFTAKFDYQPMDNTTITLGGSFNANDRTSWTLNRSMYNFEENPDIKDLDYRLFARVTQRIASTYKSGEENAGVFRNVYFTLQAEYGKQKQTNEDATHKDNFWAYGWNGRFTNNRVQDFTPYAFETDSLGDSRLLFAPVYSNNYTFSPVGVNQLPEQYNIVANEFWQANVGPTYSNLNEIRGPGGLRNGDGAASVMAIWEGMGNQRNLYQDFDNDQYRFTFSMNADVKNHQLRFGAEFEQRVDRGYSLAPRGLWTIGRQLAAQNYVSADLNNLISSETVLDTASGIFLVFNNFASGYSGNPNAKGFYENLRDQLGLEYNAWVDLDALDANQLTMDMFSPDELLINNVIGGYYGYDYTGKKVDGNPSFKDFYTKKENGVFTREVGAFRPTYSAFYIQDQFAIDNLNFNIGLRIDRFDANQQALKDPFLLVDAYKVGELPGGIENRPSNIGDDYVPYLATPGDYSSVIGYRNGQVWYDKNGAIVSNPDLIAQQTSTGLIVPAVKPTAGTLASSNWDIDAVFEDYEPQISVMPRVAFAFSITDQAQFFAHYDVLTQRPSSNLRNDPIEYLALVTNPDGTINNSNLRPEKTTDYELGFKQVLGKTSALTISAFYREMQNMIQITRINFAYPNTYTSYGNIDFGTVKGFTLQYDLRRTGNIRMLAGYTLQFANGTGSGANSNVELTDTEQPNIRFMVPLDFDQRHQFTASVDYRYGEGSAYNGPLIGGKPVLKNTGVNFIFKANSGTPYTSQERPTREAAAIGWQDNGQRVVEGAINGARTPWQFRVDMRLEKDITLKVNEKKSGNLNVYLLIQNLLDTRNVVNVYRATGNADDDGFINSADGQQLSASQVDQQAFIDQYGIRVQNPDNFSLPRRARIGVRFDF
jgi:outer membrane receptor protein involved in Fe transport